MNVFLRGLTFPAWDQPSGRTEDIRNPQADILTATVSPLFGEPKKNVVCIELMSGDKLPDYAESDAQAFW